MIIQRKREIIEILFTKTILTNTKNFRHFFGYKLYKLVLILLFTSSLFLELFSSGIA